MVFIISPGRVFRLLAAGESGLGWGGNGSTTTRSMVRRALTRVRPMLVSRAALALSTVSLGSGSLRQTRRQAGVVEDRGSEGFLEPWREVVERSANHDELSVLRVAEAHAFMLGRGRAQQRRGLGCVALSNHTSSSLD